jgi:hypothetical protein
MVLFDWSVGRIFVCVWMGGRMGCSGLGSSRIWCSSLPLFLTLIFSPHRLMLTFSFIWSSHLFGCKRYKSDDLFLTPSWNAFLSYCHGLPNKMWLACICTTWHRTSSTYFPIENGITTCLVTFTSPLSFSHCNLYGLTCLTVHKFSLLTRVVLQTLTQFSLSIIILYTLLCT